MTRSKSALELPDDWGAALRDLEYSPLDASRLVTRLASTEEASVWPEPHLVFRAFHNTPLHVLRAVVVGQDPYPQRGRATGLAFELIDGPTRGGSLDYIFKNLEADPQLSFRRPTSGGDLRKWAEQGVLLLNAALTVREGKPKSHRTAWRAFTAKILKVVTTQRQPIPIMFFGTGGPDWAQTRVDQTPHLAIRTTHPVAWCSSNVPLFRALTPFSDANAFLVRAGVRPIDWRL